MFKSMLFCNHFQSICSVNDFFFSDDEDGDVTLRRQKEDVEMRDIDGAPDASAEREPVRPPIDNRAPAPLPQQARDEDEDLYEAPVGYSVDNRTGKSLSIIGRP